jgi:hypothetical protein
MASNFSYAHFDQQDFKPWEHFKEAMGSPEIRLRKRYLECMKRLCSAKEAELDQLQSMYAAVERRVNGEEHKEESDDDESEEEEEKQEQAPPKRKRSS